MHVERKPRGDTLQVLLLTWLEVALRGPPPEQLPHGTQDLALSSAAGPPCLISALASSWEMLVLTPLAARGQACVHASRALAE